mmetsp:Transcript_20300/g.30003  ORF Transcript_20300/g.30003 Transcript_20300/m.30003 type:complete len:738 (-) Transcript_20300:38-2251(-)
MAPPPPANSPSEIDQIIYSASSNPSLTSIACSLAGIEPRFSPVLGENLPSMALKDGRCLSGDEAIAKYISRKHVEGDFLLESDPFLASECDQLINLASMYSSNSSILAEGMEKYLKFQTFLCGDSLSLADMAVFIKLSSKDLTAERLNLSRWYSLISSLPEVVKAIACMKGISGKANKLSEKAKNSSNISTESVNKKQDPNALGSLPPLEGAEEGKVMTRFPPEPSGYLHIGHVKACLLNEYYARRYNGKLLVRFDDTNPSKEKDEFEDAIVYDLALLGIKGDVLSHTSDFFSDIQKYAEKGIKEGWAYMDDTPQEQMQAERLALKESKRRNSKVEDNLSLFTLLCSGDKSVSDWCLRAKIDMKSTNGTMRDPVMYRMNLLPHHRTGSKYKAYPTYDFACPIVDSIEGVTHALRTTEYNDRDEQYAWFQEKLGIRKTTIHAFARMNFVQTVLSKRKLAWFVSEGLVDGWFDPRFPTVQGVIRRGVSIQALREFILAQGASRRITTMQWDKFWATNKAQYEPTAHRFMGVFEVGAVPLKISNAPEIPERGSAAISVPVHPKNPSMGLRPMRIGPIVLLEKNDANETTEGESITLMRWGIVKITKVVKGDGGEVVEIEGELDPDGVFKGTRKLNWITKCNDLVHGNLVEFDYLITKEKLEEGEDVRDFLTPCTKAESPALLDPCMRSLKEGEVVQLERRGFFRVDSPYGGSENAPLVLFMIPDGKSKAMSTLSSALKHV